MGARGTQTAKLHDLFNCDVLFMLSPFDHHFEFRTLFDHHFDHHFHYPTDVERRHPALTPAHHFYDAQVRNRYSEGTFIPRLQSRAHFRSYVKEQTFRRGETPSNFHANAQKGMKSIRIEERHWQTNRGDDPRSREKGGSSEGNGEAPTHPSIVVPGRNPGLTLQFLNLRNGHQTGYGKIADNYMKIRKKVPEPNIHGVFFLTTNRHREISYRKSQFFRFYW